MKIQLTARRKKGCSAWSKAPNDAAKVALELGFVELDVDSLIISRGSFLGRVLNKLGLLKWVESRLFSLVMFYLSWRFKRGHGGELFIQHPIPNLIYADIQRIRRLEEIKKIGVKIIVLVHDVGMLRGETVDVGGKTDVEKEVAIFSLADSLILHNERMRQWFINQGYNETKLKVLGFFDYLYKNIERIDLPLNKSNLPRVAIAGGMTSGGRKYYELLGSISNVLWKLYGKGYDSTRINGLTIEYCGAFSPDEIPMKLDADFGLVWDGDSLETCSGSRGEYLRYNNPHKLSLYIASGLPVIVWKESAISDIVTEKGIGVAVSSLKEIASIVSNLSTEEYSLMKKNVQSLGVELRNGYFLRNALQGEEDMASV